MSTKRTLCVDICRSSYQILPFGVSSLPFFAGYNAPCEEAIPSLWLGIVPHASRNAGGGFKGSIQGLFYQLASGKPDANGGSFLRKALVHDPLKVLAGDHLCAKVG